MDYGIANQNGRLKYNDIVSILDLAWENNIRTLDTARSYGESEKYIGKYLKKHKMKSWEIITKFNNKSNILPQLHKSIEMLSVYPISVLAHSVELFLDDVFQVEIQDYKEKNFIKYSGVSVYNEDEIHQILNSRFKPDIIQIPINILDTRLYHKGLLARLNEYGIEIHARSVFLQGLFYLPEDILNKRFPDVVPHINKLKSIASEFDFTLAEISLLWLVSLKEVDKVVIGLDNASHLNSHLETLERNIEDDIFEELLSFNYENENILNPSLWPLAY